MRYLGRRAALGAVLAAVLMLTALPGVVAADDPQYVYFFGAGNCLSQGGEIQVDADEPVILRFGWGAKTRGLVMDWINGSDQWLTIDDGDPLNVNAYWGAPYPTNPNWRALVSYPLGSLASGESVTASYNSYMRHRLHDGYSYLGEKHPTFFGPGWFFESGPTCTITAA